MSGKAIGIVFGAVFLIGVGLFSYDAFLAPRQAPFALEQELPEGFRRDGPFVVAALLPLSGPFEKTGDQVKTLLDLAVRDINRAGGVAGRDLEIKFFDTQCLEQEAQVKMQEALSARPAAVFGGICRSEGLMIARLAQGSGVLSFSFTPAAEHSLIGNLALRATLSEDQLARLILQDILKDSGFKETPARVAVVYDSAQEESRFGADAFARQAREEALSISLVIDASGEFSKIKNSLEAAKGEYLFLPLSTESANRVLAAAQSHPWPLRIYGPVHWQHAAPLRFSEKFDMFFPSSPGEIPLVLRERLAEEGVRGEIAPEAVRAYDLLRRLADVFTTTGEFPDKAAERLRAESRKGVMGDNYSFDERGDLRDGGWILKKI